MSGVTLSSMMTMSGTLAGMDKPSLKQFADQWRKSAEHTEALRLAVANAIRTADAEGMPQKDIAEATGYTRQQVRRIVNADPEKL